MCGRLAALFCGDRASAQTTVPLERVARGAVGKQACIRDPARDTPGDGTAALKAKPCKFAANRSRLTGWPLRGGKARESSGFPGPGWRAGSLKDHRRKSV